MYFDIEKKEALYYLMHGTGLAPTPHMHTHVELVVVLGGQGVCVADEKRAEVFPGDAFISFPNQIHYYEDVRPVEHDIMIFSPDICPEFAKMFRQGVPECPVVKGFGNRPGVRDILDGMFQQGKAGPFQHVKARAQLLLLLCELMPSLEIRKSVGCDGNTLKKIISYCYDNYKGDISLDSTAAALGLSKYYISHLFHEKLKTGFKEYINFMRVQAACDQLHTREKTITEIAYDTGFDTPRTFNRCFLAVKGMTPRQYRALPAQNPYEV